MEKVIDLLRARGFIEAVTGEEIRTITNQPVKIYCGFDPTSDSLHLGNLVGIMGLAWFQRCGHTPVAIVGGATGMIGDPSGKTEERQLLTPATIEHNLKGIRRNLEAVLRQGKIPPMLLNNLDWFKEFTLIDFLRDVGKFFRLGPMLGKESVRKRLEASEEGMSFTEFSYQLLQGYDFLYLYQKYQVRIQIGGSDQWGNIIAGTDLIRKVTGQTAYGLTFPLLVKSDGQKFGKTEQGAVWLSPDKLSPYEFYQYLYRTPDADVINLLRMLTFLPIDEIRSLERSMQAKDYVPNTVQKILAQEITKIVHGDEGLQTALKVTQAAAPGSQTVLDVNILEQIAQDMPSVLLSADDITGKKLIDLLVTVKMLPSKAEAKRMVKNGGVYLNNKQMSSEDRVISPEDIFEGRLLLLSIGKKNKMLVKVK